MKTAQEIIEETEDLVFAGVKKEKRKELTGNLLKLIKLSREIGVNITSATMIDYYLEENKLPPEKLLGIKFRQ